MGIHRAFHGVGGISAHRNRLYLDQTTIQVDYKILTTIICCLMGGDPDIFAVTKTCLMADGTLLEAFGPGNFAASL